MNKTELKVELVRHGDTLETLAEALGITRVTLSNKINKDGNFTQGEIMAIKNRYSLTADRIEAIFFDNEVS